MHEQMLTASSTTFQWIFWGYSLTYSRDGGPYIGTLRNFGLKEVLAAPSPGSAVLPEILFCLFQLLFGTCTVSIPLQMIGTRLTLAGDDSCGWRL